MTSDPERAEGESKGLPAKPAWRRALTHPLAHLLYAFIAVGLIQAFVVKLYYVPSSSMEPTLMPGDRIFVNRIALLWDTPSTGEVIVFDAGEGWDEDEVEVTPLQQLRYLFGSLTGIGPSAPHTLVKRVIATGGQTVSCCDVDGRVLVDGQALDEPYVVNDFPWEPGVLDCNSDPASMRCFDEFEVPDGRLVVLGDNRVGSTDSVTGCRAEGVVLAEACIHWAERNSVVGFVADGM